MIRPKNLLTGIPNAALHCLVPIRKLPAWDSLSSWAGGPAATVLVVALIATAWIALVLVQDAGPPRDPWQRRAAPLAGAFLFCAYLPNFFWFISARHNYLPSFGLTLLIAAALSRWPERSALPRLAAGWLFFGVSAAAGIAEGHGWRRAAELHEAFRHAAPILLPGRPDNLFLLGAPRSVARAPAFEHPQEALYLYSQATGTLPLEGDLSLSPGRTGAFYSNQVELFGRESLRWRAYEGMNVLVHEAGRFSCARLLRLRSPDGSLFEAAVKGGPHCSSTLVLEAPSWLVRTRPIHPRGSALATAENGAALMAVAARQQGSRLELSLSWRAARLLRDFAVVASLRDAAGRVVFEPIYGIESGGHRGHKTLWPVYNDVYPPSRWKAGWGATETYQYRLDKPLPAGPLQVELALFARQADAWAPVGTLRTPAFMITP